jgi:hypothetical protein
MNNKSNYTTREDIIKIRHHGGTSKKITDEGCRVFISGPMTGYADYNRAMFDLAEDYLHALGCAVFNPGNLTCFDEGWDHDSIMDIDLSALKLCDAILHLPGWERSKGAFEEANTAKIFEINEAYFECPDGTEFASASDSKLPDILVLGDNPMDADLVPITEEQIKLFKALRKKREAN